MKAPVLRPLSHLALVLLATNLAACGDDDSLPDGAMDAAMDSALDDAPALDAPVLDAPSTDALSTTITGCVVDSSTNPHQRLAGVTVTIPGLSELAATTDEYGDFTLAGVPVGQAQLRFELDNYFPMVSRVMTLTGGAYGVENGQARLAMMPVVLVENLAPLMGGIDETKPWVLVRARSATTDEYLQSATFAVDGAGCRGPFYLADNGLPDTTRTQTGAQGAAVFLDCNPGEFALTMAHPTLAECTSRGPDLVYPFTLRLATAGADERAAESFPGSFVCSGMTTP